MDPMRPNNSVPVRPGAQTQPSYAPNAPAAKPEKPKGKGKKALKLLLTLLVLAALAFFGWKYMEAQKELKKLADPQAAAQAETQRLVAEVGKLIELPQDETPTIATVVDAGKIKEQPFFSKAENNDRVLIYTQNRKAILYRPSTGKIIEVAPINIGNSQNGTQTNQSNQ